MKVKISRKEFFPDPAEDGLPRWPVSAYHVVLHLSDGGHVFTCLSGVRPLGEYSSQELNRVLSDLTDQVERKLGQDVVEIDVVEHVHYCLEVRAILLPGARRTFEGVRVTPVPDLEEVHQAKKQYDAPGLELLAGAPVSRMRELRRTSDWPKPTSTGRPAVRPTGRAVTPARKREILDYIERGVK